jgi:hypothetical protein
MSATLTEHQVVDARSRLGGCLVLLSPEGLEGK